MIDNLQKIDRIALNISLYINLYIFTQTNHKIKTKFNCIKLIQLTKYMKYYYYIFNRKHHEIN